MSRAGDHVERNRAQWDEWADSYAESGERHWAENEPSWGLWEIPEAEVGMFPPELGGMDAVELGCGTAYVSSWLARRGARPVGVDNSPAQLATARRLQERHGVEFPLIEANAESVPLPDASFDLVVSEYGASIWCEPELWIAEAARLLRPGGRLAFLVNTPLLMLCSPDQTVTPAGESLLRPYFGMRRFEWPGTDGDDSVEFHLPHGEMIALLRSHGFEVEALHELRAPEGATTRHEYVTAEWARKWPSEEVWKARLSG